MTIEADIKNKIKPGQLYEIRPDGKWNIFLDATMVGAFGMCQQYFEYSFVENLTPKGERPWARDIGSWWSEVMEGIYGSWFSGVKLSDRDVITLAIKTWNKLQMDDLERYHPKVYKEFGGVNGAVVMISDYAERQLPIDYSTWKIIAAEASFGRNRDVIIGETDKIVLYWMGQPDLFVIANDRIMPVDHKSVDVIKPSTALKYKPHIQLPGYIIAGQILLKQLGHNLPIDRCVINAVARKDETVERKTGETRPRFKRIFISYNESELEEWRLRRLRQAELIRQCIETGIWTWQEYACSNMWGRPCPYQIIDNKPPDVRNIIKLADFKKKEAWIPGGKEEGKEIKIEENQPK